MLAYTYIEKGTFALMEKPKPTLIAHRFPLSVIEEAYRIFENKLDGGIKVVII
jgi:threonine dehydrogenase-like Zn-dependent dehydrogenase